jgi:isopenicillin N synthase-like dioxygenase
MRSIAIGLGLKENFFDSKINEQSHNLRLLSYPPIERRLLKNDGQARAGAHSGLSVSFQEPSRKPDLVLT